jgi:hypothetical protein
MNIYLEEESDLDRAPNPASQPLWGRRAFHAVPSAAETVRLAKLARIAAPRNAQEPVDLSSICAMAGARVRVSRLGGKEGEQEAMLAPLPGDRFGISVDPTPRGGWRHVPRHRRAELKRHRTRFRIGHELGHALFYSRGGSEPRRRLLDSTAQEEFCDSFSRELLIPRSLAKQASPTPEGLVYLQATCDVSLELAARAMSCAQPHLHIALWYEGSPSEGLSLQWGSAGSPRLPPAQPRRSTSAHLKWIEARQQLLLVKPRS